MILQALYDYYYRHGKLPQKGMELKEIGFLIVIDKEGHFLRQVFPHTARDGKSVLKAG